MNLKVTKNIQQLVAQRRAKKIETVRNEVITVNLKDARAKLAESTTTPTPVAADVSSGTDLESVDAPIPPAEPAAPDVPVKKPTRSRSRSKSKAKK